MVRSIFVRIAGDTAITGHEVDWKAVTGSADQLVDALGRFAEIGVGDLSIVPGQDDAQSRHTIEVLANEVLPQLAS